MLGSEGHGEDLRPMSHKVLDLAASGGLLRWCSLGLGCDGFIPLFSPAVLRWLQFTEENMTAARLRLASVRVVVARWCTDLDVIFIISGVRCIAMIEDE